MTVGRYYRAQTRDFFKTALHDLHSIIPCVELQLWVVLSPRYIEDITHHYLVYYIIIIIINQNNLTYVTQR